MTALLTKLGLAAETKAVIITSKNYGESYCVNQAVANSMSTGIATSTAIRVPCPWARHAAAGHIPKTAGIDLTFLSEYDLYRWRPLSHAPSLADGDGGFPRTRQDFWDHADLDETRRECKAQIERAKLWGIQPTHLSSHNDVLLYKPEFFDIYLEMAAQYQLPISLGENIETIGFPVHELSAQESVLSPEFTIDYNPAIPFDALISSLQPGVTEIRFRPVCASEEVAAYLTQWQPFTKHYEALTDHAALAKHSITCISFNDLRIAQQS